MTEEKPPETEFPSGFCRKCGHVLDDHDGWLTAEGPKCPKKGAVRNV